VDAEPATIELTVNYPDLEWEENSQAIMGYIGNKSTIEDDWYAFVKNYPFKATINERPHAEEGCDELYVIIPHFNETNVKIESLVYDEEQNLLNSVTYYDTTVDDRLYVYANTKDPTHTRRVTLSNMEGTLSFELRKDPDTGDVAFPDGVTGLAKYKAPYSPNHLPFAYARLYADFDRQKVSDMTYSEFYWLCVSYSLGEAEPALNVHYTVDENLLPDYAKAFFDNDLVPEPPAFMHIAYNPDDGTYDIPALYSFLSAAIEWANVDEFRNAYEICFKLTDRVSHTTSNWLVRSKSDNNAFGLVQTKSEKTEAGMLTDVDHEDDDEDDE
jgi:hypothetical protein